MVQRNLRYRPRLNRSRKEHRTMALPTIQTLQQLQQAAKSTPLLAPRDESITGLLRIGRGEHARMSSTTLEHVGKYMFHLSKALPRILQTLANPLHWKAERLFDPDTATLRRPKIYLNAKISERRTLYISWGLTPTSPFDYVGGTQKDLRDSSDFKTIETTWPFGDAPGYTIVRLTEREHPSSRDFGLDDDDCLIREQDRQRDAFLAFLAAMVGALRATLDVEIEDWVAFEDPWSLQVVSVSDRVRALARAQHETALFSLEIAEQNYQSTLDWAGVTAKQLQAALDEESHMPLKEVLESLFGNRVPHPQIRACVREHDAVEGVRAREAQCRAILVEAEAARG